MKYQINIIHYIIIIIALMSSNDSCISSRVIFGCVWNWCVSGVKSVTVDFGAEIKSEFSFR